MDIIKWQKKKISNGIIGEDRTQTAMAKTAGLPIAIASLKILNKEVLITGVQIPIHKEIYTPILKELKQYGIVFKEQNVPYLGYNPNTTIS